MPQEPKFKKDDKAQTARAMQISLASVLPPGSSAGILELEKGAVGTIIGRGPGVPSGVIQGVTKPSWSIRFKLSGGINIVLLLPEENLDEYKN